MPYRRGYRYRGQLVQTRFAVDTYTGLIERLWTHFPERREAVRQALNAAIGVRRGMAESPEQLFPGKSASWRRDKYRRLSDGTCIDINLSNAQKLERLRGVVMASGLAWDGEVVVYGMGY